MIPYSHIFDAWILDAQVHHEGIILWLKLLSGKVIPAIHKFKPSFYIVFSQSYLEKRLHFSFNNSLLLGNLKKSEQESTYLLKREYEKMAQILNEHQFIESVNIVNRRIHAEDINFSLCLEIFVNSPFKLKTTIKHLKKMEKYEFYNSDLPMSQIYFYQSGLFPFAFIKVSIFKKKNLLYIKDISLNDSINALQYKLPPLRIVWLDFTTKSKKLIFSLNDPIDKITITIDPESSPMKLNHLIYPEMININQQGTQQIIIDEKNEFETLTSFEEIIKRIDPDIIFTHKGDESIFPLIVNRCRYHHIDNSFSLSRDGSSLIRTSFKLEGSDSFFSYGQIFHRSNEQYYLNGRLHINSSIMGTLHFNDGNLHGIVEIARISYIPLQRLTRITIGGALQSIQFYYAYQEGILIPEEKKNSEYFQNAENLLFSDRGGHILNPKVGMFDRVAELDFTSMYPSLMVKYNISAETINCRCCKEKGKKVPGLSYYICQKRKGIVSLSLKTPLDKRIAYKKLQNEAKGPDLKKYKQIQSALKWILVVCFGYLGFRNARFGRIEAHQTVCAFARQFLVDAMDITQLHTIRYLHGIVDSLYIQAPNSMSEQTFFNECVKITEEISTKTNIPISFDPSNDYFKFISFLPSKAEPIIGALNRYWGMKPSGKVKVRGLELRRHDAPLIVKKFQEELMYVIGNSEYRWDFKKLLFLTIRPLFKKYFNYLRSEQVPPEDLAITIRLTRTPDQYIVQNYQSIASKHLKRAGLLLGPGQKISFIIINDKAENKMERVLPIQFFQKKGGTFDIHKYQELFLRAFINLLPFQLSENYKILLMNSENKQNNVNIKQISIKKFF